jgi:hypothetical protein
MADSINTFQEEAPESPEHQQAMLDRERGAPVDEWLPEKFKTAEDMAKAYSSLESKLGQSKEPPESEVQETPSENPSEVAELLDSKGLDFSVFQEEYSETGTLSDDAYTALNEAGFSKPLVDSWIAGQDAMYSLAGGEEQYSQMVQWASDNLPESEIDAFNATMNTQDANMISLAVQGMVSRYRSEAEPTLIQGSNNSEPSGGKFESTAQMTTAMRDPRYATDPAYRQEVANRLAKSSLF